jgi:hypothetical protein
MEREIKKADPQYRKLMKISFALVYLIIFAGYFLLKKWSSQWIQFEHNAEITTMKTILLIKYLTYCVSIVSILYSFYFIRTGLLILRDNEFPPPKMKVMYDTVIKRGKAAKIKGYTALGIAGVLLFVAIVFPFYMHSLLRAISRW